MSHLKVHTLQLRNGMRVVLRPQRRGYSLTGLLAVNVGSRYEKETELGIAHFLEHIISHQTGLWKDKADFHSLVEKKGLYYNAYTWIYNTAYWFEGMTHHLEDILEYLRQIVFHSRITNKLIVEERGIVLEEWKMLHDEPARFIQFLIAKQKYGNHPLGHWVIGTREAISSFQQEQLKNYLDKFYSPNNTVLVLVGNFPVEEAQRLIENRFSEKPSQTVPQLILFKDSQTQPRIAFAHRQTNQAHVRLDFKGPGASPHFSQTPEDLWALEVIAAIFAAGNASIFKHHLVNQRGLINDFDFDIFRNYEVSDIQIGFTGPPQTMVPNIQEVVNLFSQLKEGHFNHELQRAKEILKSLLIFKQEDQFNLAEFTARYFFLTQEILALEDFLQKIDAVTADDIQRTATKYFTPNNANLAWVGPQKPDLNQLRNILYLLDKP